MSQIQNQKKVKESSIHFMKYFIWFGVLLHFGYLFAKVQYTVLTFNEPQKKAYHFDSAAMHKYNFCCVPRFLR